MRFYLIASCSRTGLPRWVCFAKLTRAFQLGLFRQNPGAHTLALFRQSLPGPLALFRQERLSLPLALFRQIHNAVSVALFGQKGNPSYRWLRSAHTASQPNGHFITRSC